MIGFGGSMALRTPGFGAFSLQSCDMTNFCCFKPPVCLCYSNPGKQILVALYYRCSPFPGQLQGGPPGLRVSWSSPCPCSLTTGRLSGLPTPGAAPFPSQAPGGPTSLGRLAFWVIFEASCFQHRTASDTWVIF